jgi:hypothetical protein
MRLQHAAIGFIGSLALFVSVQTHAAKVLKIDGRKVMIDLEGDTAKDGDVFVVYDPAGKRKALVKIKGVKGSRAVGIVGKGKAQAGWKAKISEKTAGKSKSGSRTARTSSPEPDTSSPSGTSFWGLMGGLAMNSMSVDIDNNNDGTSDKTASLDGMGFSAKGLFDYELFSQVWFRGLAGIEGLDASGSSEVGCGGKACSVSIYYLAADLWGRFVFSEGSFRPWIGAAFSLMFPLSKDATALQDSSITNTSAISIGGGIDWFTSPTFYIPIQVEYSMLPKSETVEASAINARIGIAMPF